MTIEQIIRAVQADEGLLVDGRAGPRTWTSIFNRYFPAAAVPELSEGISKVDERSESNIATLHPRVQPLARSLVHSAAAQGITIKVTSGTRTYAEQDALYRQYMDGKDNDGDGRVDESDERVTRARAGYSWHNHGLAFDVTIFDGNLPVWESPAYKALGSIGISLGLEWGGSWSSIIDEPHFQFNPRGLSIAQLRERHDSGHDLFA